MTPSKRDLVLNELSRSDFDPFLLQETHVSCQAQASQDEVFSALGSLQTGKSPGSDGLSTEFHLAFWDDLGDVLLQWFGLGRI